jgi:hypothetical protein
VNPSDALDEFGAVWSPDFDDYAAGRIDASQVTCLMCQQAPCGSPNPCPKLGSPEYMARLDEIHGRTPR